MANPEVVWESTEQVSLEEGCLSFPDQWAEVSRPESVRVRFLDENNREREITANALLAKCVQHEMDHLDGVLFVDHLSTLRRGMIMRKMGKVKKQAAKK